MASIADLITKLQEFPPEWRIRTTKTGYSLEVWDPQGAQYAYVFTDERPAQHLTDRSRPKRNA